MLKDIYNSGYIPNDMLKSVFTALPKRPQAIDCKEFGTINLIQQLLTTNI